MFLLFIPSYFLLPARTNLLRSASNCTYSSEPNLDNCFILFDNLSAGFILLAIDFMPECKYANLCASTKCKYAEVISSIIVKAAAALPLPPV